MPGKYHSFYAGEELAKKILKWYRLFNSFVAEKWIKNNDPLITENQ